MSRSKMVLGPETKLSDFVTLGVLADYVSREDARAAIAEAGAQGSRNRLLNAETTALYVVAMSLFRHASVQEVLRILLEGFRFHHPQGAPVAAKSSIAGARGRLGKEAMRRLFQRLAVPMASARTPGARFKSWTMLAFDGSTLALPDTKANALAFGYPGDPGTASFPILRCACLIETGTHAALAAEIGPYASGEAALARTLFAALTPGTLLLGDRNFLAFDLWKTALATGADLLWRVTSSWPLKETQSLPDGSWLAKINAPRGSTRAEEITLRVVRYTVAGSDETYRLVTSILEPERASAQELAELYKERWEIEGVFDEIKNHLKGPRTLLRSKTPELIEQEFWGLLIAHRAIRSLMHEVALKHHLEPDEVSFTHTVAVVRRTLPQRAAFSPSEDQNLERGSPSGNLQSQKLQ